MAETGNVNWIDQYVFCVLGALDLQPTRIHTSIPTCDRVGLQPHAEAALLQNHDVQKLHKVRLYQNQNGHQVQNPEHRICQENCRRASVPIYRLGCWLHFRISMLQEPIFDSTVRRDYRRLCRRCYCQRRPDKAYPIWHQARFLHLQNVGPGRLLFPAAVLRGSLCIERISDLHHLGDYHQQHLWVFYKRWIGYRHLRVPMVPVQSCALYKLRDVS